MSAWTHVTAVFRIDGLENNDFKPPTTEQLYEIFGKPTASCYALIHKLESEGIEWGDCFETDEYKACEAQEQLDIADREIHPDKYLPWGSEGSLQMIVANFPCDTPVCVVTVHGDLRDFGGTNECGLSDIESWFMRVISKTSVCMLRQAFCTAWDDWNYEIMNLTYDNTDGMDGMKVIKDLHKRGDA